MRAQKNSYVRMSFCNQRYTDLKEKVEDNKSKITSLEEKLDRIYQLQIKQYYYFIALIIILSLLAGISIAEKIISLP